LRHLACQWFHLARPNHSEAQTKIDQTLKGQPFFCSIIRENLSKSEIKNSKISKFRNEMILEGFNDHKWEDKKKP
jgi:hypothetical protein